MKVCVSGGGDFNAAKVNWSNVYGNCELPLFLNILRHRKKENLKKDNQPSYCKSES
jgi:hypothetical protein